MLDGFLDRLPGGLIVAGITAAGLKLFLRRKEQEALTRVVEALWYRLSLLQEFPLIEWWKASRVWRWACAAMIIVPFIPMVIWTAPSPIMGAETMSDTIGITVGLAGGLAVSFWMYSRMANWLIRQFTSRLPGWRFWVIPPLATCLMIVTLMLYVWYGDADEFAGLGFPLIMIPALAWMLVFYAWAFIALPLLMVWIAYGMLGITIRLTEAFANTGPLIALGAIVGITSDLLKLLIRSSPTCP